MEGDWRAGGAGVSLPQDVSLLVAAFPLWLQLTQDRPVLVPHSTGWPIMLPSLSVTPDPEQWCLPVNLRLLP